jgi:hypothetical protein
MVNDVTGRGFLARELERISEAVRVRQKSPETDEYRQLYAAQQALSWALEPSGFRAPYETILDTPADSIDCPVNNRQFQS